MGTEIQNTFCTHDRYHTCLESLCHTRYNVYIYDILQASMLQTHCRCKALPRSNVWQHSITYNLGFLSFGFLLEMC